MGSVKRGYHAPLRREQAAATKRRIIEAAVAEFTEHGWASATVAAIAERAGVTSQAVYLAVGPKPRLLIHAVETAVAGDSHDIPLANRPAFADVYATGVSAHRRLQAFAHASADIYSRAAPLFMALQDAARADDATRSLADSAGERRMTDHRRLARLLLPQAAAGEVATLSQTIWVLAGPAVYIDLVHRWGWTPERYAAWLSSLLHDAVKNIQQQRRARS